MAPAKREDEENKMAEVFVRVAETPSCSGWGRKMQPEKRDEWGEWVRGRKGEITTPLRRCKYSSQSLHVRTPPRAPAALSQWVTLDNLTRSFWGRVDSHPPSSASSANPWMAYMLSQVKPFFWCISEEVGPNFTGASPTWVLKEFNNHFFKICLMPLHFLQSIP